AVVDGRRARVLRRLEGGKLTGAEDEEEVAEIDAAQRPPDGWHEDVVDQRGHDGTEGGTDDHTDGQVDGVATERKLAKLLQHGVPPEDRSCRWLKPRARARRPVARGPGGCQGSRSAQPSRAAFTFLKVSRFFCRPSTCFSISTIALPISPMEPSELDSAAFFITSPSCASALRWVSVPQTNPAANSVTTS